MADFILTLVRVCLFRSGPQDLPASRQFLVAVVVASFFVYLWGNSHLAASNQTLSITLTQLSILGGGLWLLLAIFRKSERWLQSATALYGTSAIIHLAALPVISSLPDSEGVAEQFSGSMLAIAAFQIWFFAVTVMIVKEALETTIGLSIVIAFVMQLLFAVILVGIFGSQAA